MRTIMFSVALMLAGAGAGCDKAQDTSSSSVAQAAPAAPAQTIAELTVDQVDHLLVDHACVPVDANGDPLRHKLGVLPGAVLLGDLDAAYNLPRDKATQLVFYCANPSCSASHYAADKARTAGYSRVAVMPAGIAGWVTAGKQTSSI